MKTSLFRSGPIRSAAFSLIVLAGSLTAEEPSTFELDPAAIKNLKLEFSEAKAQAISIGVRAAGVVRLDEKRVVDVVPRISGVIDEDYQQLGATVTTEDKLFRIESAELSQALTTYVDAEQAMDFAHQALEQEKKLIAKNLSSQEQLRQKELEFQMAVAEHARALQPLKLLHFNEGTIHQYLINVGAGNYTSLEVKAPTAGEVIEKSVRNGAAVEPNQRLYTIADLDALWVDFQPSLREAARLSQGMTVQVQSTISDQARKAELIYVAPVADEASRTVLARAILDNQDRAWRPGTPVVVVVTGDDSDATLAVPASAVVDFHGGKAVFLRSGASAFTTAPVKTGRSDGRLTEILSGIDPGSEVVSVNAAQLKGHLEMTAEE